MNDLNRNINSPSFVNTSFRLVIKNIPENLSDEQLLDILSKNFEENKIRDINIIKLEHKYKMKNNKICYVTVENLEMRKQLFNFFSGFELVDPKGFKQKLAVVDCLYQNKGKSMKDPIENSLEKSK
jgi:hypothetical protein